MKNKGVIIAIALIIITGACVTVGTRRFINDKTSGDMASVLQGPISSASETGVESQSVTVAGLGSAPFAGSPENGREPDAEAGQGSYGQGQENIPESQAGRLDGFSEAAQADTAAESWDGVPDEAAAFHAAADSDHEESAGIVAEKLSQENTERFFNSSVTISPLTGTDQSLEAEAGAAVSLQGFRRKLSEIDSLVQNMQGSEAGSNTDSLKNVADYEYRLWDSELNLIYQSILEGMTEEEAETLKIEERKWIRARDSAASKAAARYKGGTMESLEYTASLAHSTRSRAHELLDNYGQYLKQEED